MFKNGDSSRGQVAVDKMKKLTIILTLLTLTCVTVTSCGQTNNKTATKVDRTATLDSLIKLATTSDSLHLLKNSVKYYSMVLDIDSLKLVALINRGRALVTLGQTDKGFVDYDKAVKHYPHENTYYARGMAYCIINKYDDAMKDFAQAVLINPKFGQSYYGYSLYFLNSKKFDNASYWCHVADSLSYVP